ncbi:MAG: hypothetical protein MN733_31340, partial [Nitrososphaera sp.]|nr:hypothetical protein [Nitrososphaera sp.]
MATVADIKWGSYKIYSGPWTWGKHRFALPSNPNDDEKAMAILSATEGCADGVNMYDRCVISVGFVQWCGSTFMVDAMLKAVYAHSPSLLDPLLPAMAQTGASFNTFSNKMFVNGPRGVVDTLEEQQKLFLLNSNGQKGTWDDASTQHAKTWAACMATVFENPEAQRVQASFTSARLRGFLLPFAKSVFGLSPQTPVG